MTSQVDLTPTILALTGASPDKLKQAGQGLPGYDFSSLLTTPGAAKADTLRPGSLFCYNMLSYQDARWAAHFDVKSDNSVPLAQRIAAMEKQPPDFQLRCSTASDTLTQLRADRLDIAFVAGTPKPPDCHSRRIWTEPLLAAVSARHPLAGRSAATWADLAADTFIVRHGGTGPQVHDHIVLRLAGTWPAPSILRFDVGRGTLLSMVGQDFGITVIGAASSLLPTSGVVFLPITDEPEPVAFSAVWSPHSRSVALRNLLGLADNMSRSNCFNLMCSK